MLEAKNIVVLGIDPGINHTGWSILHYSNTNDISSIVTFGTIEANDIAKKFHKEDFKQFSKVISLEIYRAELKSLMEKYNPQFVACEDAFYNPRMPNAFLSLKLCIHTIQQLLFQEYRKPLYLIAPKLIKQVISDDGTASKTAVQDAITNRADLIVKDTKNNPVAKMVEHEADSIAIAYSFVKLFLRDKL